MKRLSFIAALFGLQAFGRNVTAENPADTLRRWDKILAAYPDDPALSEMRREIQQLRKLPKFH